MLLGNSYGQDLFKHSIAVGLLSKNILEKYFPESLFKDILQIYKINEDDKILDYNCLTNVLFNIGVYHDIGKVDPNFQLFLQQVSKDDIETFDVQIDATKEKKDFDINTYPLHHEISWAIVSSFSKNEKYKEYYQNLIEYVIYWHHAKILRDKDIFNKKEDILTNQYIDLKSIICSVKDFQNKVDNFIKEKKLDVENFYINSNKKSANDFIEASKGKSPPTFQSTNFINGNDLFSENVNFIKNSLNYLLRAIVVSADRIISGCSSNELDEIVNTNNYSFLISENFNKKELFTIEDGIKSMLKNFKSSERSKKQEVVAEELAKINDIAVLNGPAGVGKTKIMLDWVNRKNKKNKVFIITPKTSICNSLYKEISENYLPKNSIEIVTGEKKEKSKNRLITSVEEDDIFNSDFNITTIDQLLSLMMSHKKIDVFLEVLNSTIIFDEFHEFLDTPGIIMLFIQFIALKRMSINNDCLLVSATPNPYLLNKKLNISQKNIIKIESFNETKYEIEIKYFEDKKSNMEIDSDMYHAKEKGQIVLFNNATKAQISAIRSIKEKENKTLVYHSKFFEKDREAIFNQIISEFGNKNKDKESILRTGPILQASIDISTHSMLTEISSIDNIFQRLGRVVRWGENTNGKYTIYIPTNLDNKATLLRQGLENVGSFNNAKAFADFISEKLKDKKIWTLNELYPLYDEFFSLEETLKAYDKDWLNIIEKSKEVFQQGFEPIKIIIKKKKLKDNKSKTLAKKSLRGKSIFALACSILYKNSQEIIIEPEKDFSIFLFSIEKNSITRKGKIIINNLLEDNRQQIDKNYNKSPYLYEIRMNLKEKNNIAQKNNISKLPVYMFLDFARDNRTPLILSFKGDLNNPKMNKDEERFNIEYEEIKLGIMEYSLFKKVK